MKKLFTLLLSFGALVGISQNIALSTDTVFANVSCGDSMASFLTVYNTSGGVLNVDYLGITDSTDLLSELYYSTTAATTVHNFTGLSPVNDTLFLELTVNGDFDLTSEFADVYADGNFIGTLNPTVNNADVTTTFFIVDPTLSTITADGNISINVVNSSSVNTGYGTMMHRVRLYSKGISWAQSASSTTALTAPDSVVIPIYFNSTGLNQGTYYSIVTINSNDIAMPSVDVVLAMQVNGNPEVLLSDSCVVFPGTLVGQTSTYEIAYTNIGCDTLTATVDTLGTGFQLTGFSGDLVPGASGIISVSFTPSSFTNYDDTVLLNTNIGAIRICLSGNGVPPPAISVAADTINVALDCSDSTIIPFTVYSVGSSTLNLTGGQLSSAGIDQTSELYYSITDATTNHSFTGLTSFYDTLYFEITVNGDFDLTSEFADIYVEGNLIGTLNPTVNNANVTATYFITGTALSTVLADGTVNVAVDNSSSVNTGYGTMMHRVRMYSYGAGWVYGTVPTIGLNPGDSTILNVQVNALGLLVGNYETIITISSNDPATPQYDVVVQLEVTGVAEMALSDTCVAFPGTLLGVQTDDSIIIYNDGCDTLLLNSASFTHGDYGSNFVSSMVLPGQQITLEVYYTPSSTGINNASMTLSTSVGNTVVCLSGEGLPAPQLTYSPDTLSATLTCNGTQTQFLTVYNTGGSTLNIYSSTIGGGGYDFTSDMFYSTTGATTSHSFGNLNAIPDTLFVEITVNGDFDLTSEFADVYADGNLIGTINPTVNTADVTQTYYIVSPLLNTILADGTVNIDVVNSSSVNTGYGTMLHRVHIYSSGVSWLSGTSISATLNPGDSILIPVTFDGTGLSVGTYYGSFTISSNDPANPTIEVPVVLNLPAVVCANFTNSAQNSCTGVISFTDASFGLPTSWQWNFGDGATSTSQNSSHSYSSIGTYTVRLIACNANGCDTIQNTVNVNFLPAYDISIGGTFTTHANVNFSVAGGTPITVTWDFGDGSSLPGLTATHMYNDTGTYIVSSTMLTPGPCYFTLYDTVVITEGQLSVADRLKDGISVYPNPSSGAFTLYVSGDLGPYDAQLYDSKGVILYNVVGTTFANERKMAIDVENGMYLLRIILESGEVTERKIIVSK